MKNKIPSLAIIIVFTSYVSLLNAQSVITGTLLGSDGKPLKKCVMLMTVGGPEEKTITVEPDEHGVFRQETNHKGLHFLNFVGVGHQQQKVVLYIDEPRQVKLHVRLGPEYFAEDISQAEVRGPNAKATYNGTPLVKQADGKYLAEFPSKDSVVQYLVVKATRSGEGVPGTNADDYLIYPYGGIFAVIYGLQKPKAGKVTIILDPKNPHGPYVGKSPFSDDRSVDAQLSQIYQEINDRTKYAKADGAAQLSGKILKERNVLLRQAFWIKYLNMLFPNPEYRVATPPDLIDKEMVSKALDELTPTSPFWMLRWLFPVTLMQKSIEATGKPDRYKDYIERSVENWPYMIRGWGYRGLMEQAAQNSDTTEVDRLYERLQVLSPESPAAKYERLQRERKAAAKVVLGSQVPTFRAHSLEDSTVVYTPRNINAKFYLIDFWATWCGPCIQEFPYLQKSYEKFHDKGFEIISYSVDASREVVMRFRKEKFPMPWLHAIDPQLRATDSKMVKQFEVYFYPTAFLVDSSGTIIATTEDLRGPKLSKLLEGLFASP